ncbi:hypothetical protein TCAL_02180 [Tigriopus californicus]|uniref:RRM domain-containing protein n=1 Tax=Tigriopus californicus TaxID=6832 RepID=A0A553NUQ1_TIGCA|nr:serine-arginine protein 55-like [Tigriopus californicus]TRY69153.1 hypothetical protein TCAL_02180 [Tigriopus californicus]
MGREQRVFIGNIPGHTRERDVERFFKNYGRMRDVVIKHGYGFVEFDDYRDAEDAVHELDGKELLGERLRVELARSRAGRDGGRDGGSRGDRGGGGQRGGAGYGRDRGSANRRFGGRDDRDGRRGGPPGPRTGYRLVVENVSSRTSWQDLKDFFRSSGDITYTNVHSSHQGQGIVEFADRRGLENALDKKNDLELNGRRLKIREEGRGGSSGGGGGDHGRDRSDSRGRSASRSRSRGSRDSRSRSRSKSRSSSRHGSRSRSKSSD